MNAPAKRFSLQRLLTTPPAPAPAPEPVRTVAPLAAPELVETKPAAPAPAPIVEIAPAPAVTPIRAPKADVEESHPKKKRSYSVDMKLCEDLEILAWYQSRSSSSVVEELIRKHLQHNRALLFKARDVRNAR